jgi:hypothetical protein
VSLQWLADVSPWWPLIVTGTYAVLIALIALPGVWSNDPRRRRDASSSRSWFQVVVDADDH